MGNGEKEKLKQELSEKEAEKQRIESEKEAEEKRHQDEIRHQEELQKMREDMLNKQLEQYQKMISLSKEENERRIKEQEERMRAILEEQRRHEEELKRQFEKAKNEEEKKRIEAERRKEQEKKKKAKEVYNKFKQEKEHIINEECNKIAEKFVRDKDKFCLTQIRLFDKSEIEKLVKKFENTENIMFILEEKIKKLTSDYLKEKGSTTIKHLNIVIIGPSGVGKSTLINSILELDEQQGAKEGEAEPCTMGKPIYYDSLKVNFIRVADSRGIEKSDYGISKVIEDIKEFIEGKLLTKDPDQYVHCIWYCITGARFEDVERECLKELSKIYDDNTLPVIVVYTKAMVPEIYKPIENKIKDLKLKVEFVPVISKDIEIEEECDDDEEENEQEEMSNNKMKTKKKLIKKKGIKKLMDLSVEKAGLAVQSACYTGIKNNIKEDVQKNNEKQNKKIEQYIETENNKKINKFQEGMDLKEMIVSISDLLSNVIKDYLYDDKLKSLNKDTTDAIEYFLELFFNKNLKEYKEIFETLINENSENISKKLFDRQRELKIQNDGIMEFEETQDEFKREIKNHLVDLLKLKAELYCLRNSAFFISEPIRKNFSKLLLDLFDQCLKSENIKKLFQKSAEKMFDNLKVICSNKKKNQTKTDEKK